MQCSGINILRRQISFMERQKGALNTFHIKRFVQIKTILRSEQLPIVSLPHQLFSELLSFPLYIPVHDQTSTTTFDDIEITVEFLCFQHCLITFLSVTISSEAKSLKLF